MDPGVFNFRKDLDGDSTQLHPAGAPDPRLRQQPATALGNLQGIDLFITFGRPRPSKIDKNNKSFNLFVNPLALWRAVGAALDPAPPQGAAVLDLHANSGKVENSEGPTTSYHH